MPVLDTPITKEELMKPLRLRDDDRIRVDLSRGVKEFLLTVSSAEGGDWGVPSYAATADFKSRFPQTKEAGLRTGRSWAVPATDISAQLILGLWPSEHITMSDEARTVLMYLITTVQHQQVAIHRTARYKEFIQYREVVRDLAIPTSCFVQRHDHGELHSMLHQDVGLANCLHTDGYGLFCEQGTGKTPIVIWRVDEESTRSKDDKMYKVLIVAPKNVRQNWVVEFQRFSNVLGKVTVLRGGYYKRMKQFFEAMVRDDPGQKYTVIVVSYEALSKSWDVIGKIPWDLSVLDEAHYIKGSSTQRGKSALELRDISSARMVLTGTPICNNVFDLYPLLEFMREGGSGFTSREAFKKFYGVWVTRDRGVKRLADVQNLPFLKERLARMTFVVKKSEALPDLPEKVYDVIEVEMTEKQEEVYIELRDSLIAEIESDLADESRTLVVENILVRMLRLAQITSGFVSFDPIVDLTTGEELVPKQIERFDPNPKIDALFEVLAEKEPHQKTIVWAHFKADIELIMSTAKERGIDAVEYRGGTSEDDRTDAVRRFNCDPTCRLFVGNPGAGGTGVNLLGYDYTSNEESKTNCDHVIYYSQDWSHPKRSQSEDRCHRKGTRTNVRISDMTIIGTIDEEIRIRVTDKRSSALMVQDLREIMRRVLGKGS